MSHDLITEEYSQAKRLLEKTSHEDAHDGRPERTWSVRSFNACFFECSLDLEHLRPMTPSLGTSAFLLCEMGIMAILASQSGGADLGEREEEGGAGRRWGGGWEEAGQCTLSHWERVTGCPYRAGEAKGLPATLLVASSLVTRPEQHTSMITARLRSAGSVLTCP